MGLPPAPALPLPAGLIGLPVIRSMGFVRWFFLPYFRLQNWGRGPSSHWGVLTAPVAPVPAACELLRSAGSGHQPGTMAEPRQMAAKSAVERILTNASR